MDMLSQLNAEEAELFEKILTHAATDPVFRARLIADPEDAITEEIGFTPPTDYVVRFIEKPAGVDQLVVLPDLIQADAELSEEELEAVAGGVQQEGDVCWTTCNGTSCTKTADVTSTSQQL